MNNYYLQIVIGAIIAFLVCLILIPGIIRVSSRLKLVDIPNDRKVHKIPVPRMGGIAIFLSALAGILMSRNGLLGLSLWPVLFSSLGVLFLTGVWDDLRNISPRIRLLIQLSCAIAVSATGIRLTSLYGILGIQTLNVYAQYGITILILTGATNAFNLIDGVDGLAGGLAFIGLLVLAYLSFILRLYPLVIILAAFAGAVLGFLRNNKSPAKIFMGDGGSLVLGYLISTSGILLIERAHAHPELILPSKVTLLACSILVIPVFDALRVFSSRIKKGHSPFRADKTHIHHLLLVAGMDHQKTSVILYIFQLILVLLAFAFSNSTSVPIIFAVMVILFHVMTKVLRINQEMESWLTVIKKMEKQ